MPYSSAVPLPRRWSLAAAPFLILSARAASLERQQPSFSSENSVMSGGLLHAGLAQDAGVVAFFFS